MTTQEMMMKAKAAKSAEELFAMANENGVAITEEEAQMYFAQLHHSGDLSDDELDNVAGGCGDEPEYKTTVTYSTSCFMGAYEKETISTAQRTGSRKFWYDAAELAELKGVCGSCKYVSIIDHSLTGYCKKESESLKKD